MLNGRWVEAEDDEAREIQEEATINLGPTSAAILGPEHKYKDQTFKHQSAVPCDS